MELNIIEHPNDVNAMSMPWERYFNSQSGPVLPSLPLMTVPRRSKALFVVSQRLDVIPQIEIPTASGNEG